jgi:5'-3' exonuclease
MTNRLLLDVSSLMYRAFFAVGTAITAPDGRPVGAVHSYVDWISRLIVSRHPDEVVHVYDHDWRPLARTEIYAGYKSKRPADPDGLPQQFDLLRRVLSLTSMGQAQARDWEAEDAIAAFCEDAGQDDRIEIVSGDRDLIQLVRDPVIKLLFTVRGVSELLELDEAAVLQKYGVPSRRYADFAILRGDPSDDLPGVPGVGEKTARTLVQSFESLDELLEEAASEHPRAGPLRGKPALRSRLRDARGYVADMQRLVPPNAKAPLDIWGGPRDDSRLRELADEMGLRGPVQRLLAAFEMYD